MKAKEKRMILILVAITIVMIIIMVVVKNKNKEPEEGETTYVEQAADGSKRGTSEKLNETKRLEDLEITNIQITEVKGEARIRANVTNKTSSSKTEFPITINVLNKNGEVIQKVGAYIGSMEPGETRAINALINMDISNIYDITFERK